MPDDAKGKTEGQDPEEVKTGEGKTPEPKTFDAEYVSKLRNEAADTRKKLRDAEAKVQEFENASLSEKERLEKAASESERRAIEAEGRVAETEIRADFYAKAVGEGVSNPKLAYLVAQSEGLLGALDDGKVGAHDFAALRKAAPEVFKGSRSRAGADAGEGRSQTQGSQSMDDLIRGAIRRR